MHCIEVPKQRPLEYPYLLNACFITSNATPRCLHAYVHTLPLSVRNRRIPLIFKNNSKGKQGVQ